MMSGRGMQRGILCSSDRVAKTVLFLWACLVSCEARVNSTQPHHLAHSRALQVNTAGFAKPDYSYYHKSDELLREVRLLVERHPDIMETETLSHQNEEYSADMEVVTVRPYATPGEAPRTLRALLDFGQHGREPITCEVALRLLQVLAGEAELPPGVDQVQLTGLLKQIVIKVVPAENINGKKKVEAGELCERKNGRGVDPNRNWSIDWGVKEPDYDPAEEFPGIGPFSEPEAELLQKLAATFRPHLWVNVHSGMEALFLPYDHLSSTPPDAVAGPMLELLQKVNRLHCGGRCVVGSGGGSVGYLAHGTATDYMFDVLHIPLPFTWEIYGDEKANNDDCFRMFNPVSRAVFEEVVSNWTSAFITVLSDLSLTLDKLPAPFTDDRWLVSNSSSGLGQGNGSVDGSVRGIRRDDLPWQEHSAGSIKGLAEQIKKRGSLEELEGNRGIYMPFGEAWYEILPIAVFGLVFASLLLRRSSVWLWWRRRTYSRGRGTPRAILPL
eukprot:TRINITY_DN17894_c0_g1_i1.p1 TRINITY_DN17894_c0_g1~~TRINITY_DN17894_c0_g1_i1.p1  ORF type:complete len:498 (+),score=95.97 TRINITY_DN17894_c0_g1_i1:371-1864(+)